MHAGKLIHRVLPQRPKADATRNASNEVNLRDDASWEQLGDRSRACRVTALTGSERVTAYTVEASRTHTVLLRFDAVSALIDHRCRLLWGSRILAVITADDLEGEHRWIKCNCIEVLS